MKRTLLLALALVILCLQSKAAINLVQFATGLTAPCDIKQCGDSRLFIVEQNGRIQILDTLGAKRALPFLNLTNHVIYGGERGLLGVAFPPDYLTSGYFYVNYTSQPSGYTTISRFHVSTDPNRVDSTTEEVLLSIYQPYTNHNGGHLAFGSDGYLYIGTGDGGSANDPQNRAQNPDTLLGKMLRLAVDPAVSGYLIPPTNMFASDTTLGRPEIYAMGMRNPWGWSFDRLTHDLWIGDVGQNLYEEIDFQPGGDHSGLNYGWRCYEGVNTFNTAGCQPQNYYTSPIYTYSHTGGPCSITGGYVYRGAKYTDMYGKYFFTDYCVSSIQYLTKSGSTYSATNLGTLGGAAALVVFGEDQWGELYCAGITSGKIYKFQSDCSPVAAINGGLNDTITDCGTGAKILSVPYAPYCNYTWSVDGNSIAVDSSSIIATQQGMYTVQVLNNGCTNTDSIYLNFISPLNLTFNGLDTLYCIYNNPVSLLPNYLGGTFTGSGMTGTTFNPSTAGLGMHQVTYTYTDATGCTYSVTQNVRVDLCVGIDRPIFDHLKLFPSPATREFTLNGEFLVGKNISLTIMNELGALVKSEQISLANATNLTIPISLSAGLYFVQISAEGNKQTLKLVVE